MARDTFKVRLFQEEMGQIGRGARAAGFPSVSAFIRWRALQPDYWAALNTAYQLIKLGLEEEALEFIVAQVECTNPGANGQAVSPSKG